MASVINSTLQSLISIMQIPPNFIERIEENTLKLVYILVVFVNIRLTLALKTLCCSDNFSLQFVVLVYKNLGFCTYSLLLLFLI